MAQKLLNLGCGHRYHKSWINLDYVACSPDVIAHDLRTPLPFEDNVFDAVYHSHVLEHLPKRLAPLFLDECLRVLKPGGIIRVAVPDLESIVAQYTKLLPQAIAGDKAAQERYDWIVIELFDQMVRNVTGGEMLAYWAQHPMPAEDFVFARMGSEAKNAIASLRAKRETVLSHPPPDDPMRIGQFRLSGEVHQWMYDSYSLGRLLFQAGFHDVSVCSAHQSRIPDFNTYGLDIEPDGSVRKPDSLFMEATR